MSQYKFEIKPTLEKKLVEIVSKLMMVKALFSFSLHSVSYINSSSILKEIFSIEYSSFKKSSASFAFLTNFSSSLIKSILVVIIH